MADLQERQHVEDEEVLKQMKTVDVDDLPALRNEQHQNMSLKYFPQLANVMATHDDVKEADEEALVGKCLVEVPTI